MVLVAEDAKEYIIIKHYRPTGKYRDSLSELTFEGRELTPDMELITEKRRLTPDEVEKVKRRKHIQDVQEVQQAQLIDVPNFVNRRVHNISVLPKKGFRAQGIDVAVIDGGITQFHYDMLRTQGRLGLTANFADSVSTVIENVHDHGTWCAGMISQCVHQSQGWSPAVMHDRQPDCKLSIIRWVDATASGPTSDILEAVNYAVAQRVDVMSMSMRATRANNSTALNDSITQALESAYTNNNILSVVAAGNDQTGSSALTADLNVPAVAPNAITVANLQGDGATIATDSSWGNCVDIAAIGTFVSSWGPPDRFDYYLSGTSMATPMVAGAAAMLRSAGMTPAEVRNAIKAGAVPLSAAATVVGAGRIDAYAALRTIKYW